MFHHNIVWQGDPRNWHGIDELGNPWEPASIGIEANACKPSFPGLIFPHYIDYILYDNAQGTAFNNVLQPLTTGGWFKTRPT